MMIQIAKVALPVVAAVVLHGCGEKCKGYPPYFAEDSDGQCMAIECGVDHDVTCSDYNNDEYTDVRCVDYYSGQQIDETSANGVCNNYAGDQCYSGWQHFNVDTAQCEGAPCGGSAYTCSVPCHRYGVASGVMDVYCFTCAEAATGDEDTECSDSDTSTWQTLSTKNGAAGICASGTLQLYCTGDQIYVHPQTAEESPRCESVSCTNAVFSDGACPAWAPCDDASSLCKSYIDPAEATEDESATEITS